MKWIKFKLFSMNFDVIHFVQISWIAHSTRGIVPMSRIPCSGVLPVIFIYKRRKLSLLVPFNLLCTSKPKIEIFAQRRPLLTSPIKAPSILIQAWLMLDTSLLYWFTRKLLNTGTMYHLDQKQRRNWSVEIFHVITWSFHQY